MARILFLFLLTPFFALAQTNILTTNSVAEQILLGNYDPADYADLVRVPLGPGQASRSR